MIRTVVGLNVRLIIPLILCASLVQAEELRVPGFTAYLGDEPGGVQVSDQHGVSGWTGSAVKVMWFGEIQSAGRLKASIALRLAKGTESSLRLSVGNVSRTAEALGAGKEQLTMVSFGDFDVGSGYQRFTLESLNASDAPNGDVDALHLEGPAVQGAHFNLLERRNAASVHLFYPTAKDAKIEWFYSEVTAIDDPPATFYMACGFHRGYFGMQVNSPTERRIIFSVWDAGEGLKADNRSTVAKADHVSLVAKGDGVHASVFGGEGTGGHSHLKFPWKTGEVQRFLLTAKPVSASQTVYSGWYFHPQNKAWTLISSMQAPKDGGYLKGLHGFSENFDGGNGHLRRKALYGNQWIREAEDQWTELTTATFSHDPTGKQDRLDRFMGVENGQFFLSHGGYVPGVTKYGEKFTRPEKKRPPEIKLPGA